MGTVLPSGPSSGPPSRANSPVMSSSGLYATSYSRAMETRVVDTNEMDGGVTLNRWL